MTLCFEFLKCVIKLQIKQQHSLDDLKDPSNQIVVCFVLFLRNLERQYLHLRQTLKTYSLTQNVHFA